MNTSKHLPNTKMTRAFFKSERTNLEAMSNQNIIDRHQLEKKIITWLLQRVKEVKSSEEQEDVVEMR